MGNSSEETNHVIISKFIFDVIAVSFNISDFNERPNTGDYRWLQEIVDCETETVIIKVSNFFNDDWWPFIKFQSKFQNIDLSNQNNYVYNLHYIFNVIKCSDVLTWIRVGIIRQVSNLVSNDDPSKIQNIMITWYCHRRDVPGIEIKGSVSLTLEPDNNKEGEQQRRWTIW